MEKDTDFKNILMNGAEGASPDFTNAVMKRVAGLSGSRLSYQPLVSPAVQRIFLLTFGLLVAAILVLCLLIAFASFYDTSWLQQLKLPALNYNRVLLFIITFWIVFSANRLLEKRFVSRRLFL